MSGTLHLTISTPAAILVDMEDVTAVRADDESGSFGILPGHTDFLTVLPASVVRWRTRDAAVRFCALRSGVMTVSGGRRVAIACRRGSVGDDLATLERAVEALGAAELDAERRARVEQMRLHTRAVRQLMLFLRPGGHLPGGRFTSEGDAP